MGIPFLTSFCTGIGFPLYSCAHITISYFILILPPDSQVLHPHLAPTRVLPLQLHPAGRAHQHPGPVSLPCSLQMTHLTFQDKDEITLILQVCVPDPRGVRREDHPGHLHHAQHDGLPDDGDERDPADRPDAHPE